MLKDFKEFALKGSVLDMAVGIIIGGAFTPIVKSLVDDVLMPPIGLLTGGVDFADQFFVLRAGGDGVASYPTLAAARDAGAVTLNWGVFVNTILAFLIVAFAVFLMVRGVNRWRRQEAAAPPAAPPEEVVLLREIRDAVRQG